VEPPISTIFRGVYERYGDLLHHEGAFLLEGRRRTRPRRGSPSSCIEQRTYEKLWPGRGCRPRMRCPSGERSFDPAARQEGGLAAKAYAFTLADRTIGA
jgi:hypothetical protein